MYNNRNQKELQHIVDLDAITELTKAPGNYYGGLNIVKHNSRFYWIMENYENNFKDISEWSEISEELYNLLLQYK